jgi:hypothetical protein
VIFSAEKIRARKIFDFIADFTDFPKGHLVRRHCAQ